MSEDFDLSEWLSADSIESHPVGEIEKADSQLTPNEIRILNFVEQTFWETGLLPTIDYVVENLAGVNGGKLTTFLVHAAFKKELFQIQLATRGLPTAEMQRSQSKALTPKQIIVANMMLNLHDKRSEREKLEYCKVSSQQYHAWLRQPQFVEFIRKRGEALFKSTDADAYKALVKNVKAGDNASLKLFFEMRGLYSPKLDVHINIEAVLTRVIEVVSKHVQDPSILSAIAGELEAVGEEVG